MIDSETTAVYEHPDEDNDTTVYQVDDGIRFFTADTTTLAQRKITQDVEESLKHEDWISILEHRGPLENGRHEDDVEVVANMRWSGPRIKLVIDSDARPDREPMEKQYVFRPTDDEPSDVARTADDVPAWECHKIKVGDDHHSGSDLPVLPRDAKILEEHGFSVASDRMTPDDLE